ncbi:MAG: RNA polymerase sigma factor [Gemmatimonadaceae bacterium]
MAGPSDDDLPELVGEARAGRPAAISRLISRVQGRVRDWAERFIGDADDADDVTQQVLISLEHRLQRFDGRSRFSTWLYAVTRNVALNERRRNARRAELLAERASAGIETSNGGVSADPDAVALAAIALSYFDSLPRMQRTVFELADLRGFTPAEIARELGMQQVTVRANLFKARRAIRYRLLAEHARLLEEYRS